MITIPFLIKESIAKRLKLTLLYMISTINNITRTSVTSVDRNTKIRHMLLRRLLPQLNIIIAINALARLSISVLHSLRVAIHNNNRIVIRHTMTRINQVTRHKDPSCHRNSGYRRRHNGGTSSSNTGRSCPRVFPLLERCKPNQQLAKQT